MQQSLCLFHSIGHRPHLAIIFHLLQELLQVAVLPWKPVSFGP